MNTLVIIPDFLEITIDARPSGAFELAQQELVGVDGSVLTSLDGQDIFSDEWRETYGD